MEMNKNIVFLILVVLCCFSCGCFKIPKMSKFGSSPAQYSNVKMYKNKNGVNIPYYIHTFEGKTVMNEIFYQDPVGHYFMFKEDGSHHILDDVPKGTKKIKPHVATTPPFHTMTPLTVASHY